MGRFEKGADEDESQRQLSHLVRREPRKPLLIGAAYKVQYHRCCFRVNIV